MNRGVFVLAFVFGLIGCEQEELTKICPKSCYTHESARTEGVGACRSGVPVCDKDGEVLECVGEVHPSREICDAIDNDCDGYIDESLQIAPSDEDNRCPQCGTCQGTWEICELGNWYCKYRMSAPTELDDTCDGRDNDCDCETDEDVRENNEVVFCYTGPDGTATKGNCRPGVKVCENGAYICSGEVVPEAETCDETDQNCNGIIDDVPNLYQGNDIIFGIDVSGSMGQYIDVIEEAVCLYAQATQSDPDFSVKMGLVEIANPDEGYRLTQDLTDAQTLCGVLQNLGTLGGFEPTISAAKAVADPANPLGISWRSNAKRTFIGFGDEPAQVSCDQYYCFLNNEVSESIEMCEESGTAIYWFVSYDLDGYLDQAEACGGEIFLLSTHISYLTNDLNSILNDVCLEP